MRPHRAEPKAGDRALRSVARLALACLVIGVVPLPILAAEPALRPDSLIGPLRGFFELDEPALGTDSYILDEPINRKLLRYDVHVDSTGVKYTRRAAGALTGQTMGLQLEDHLALTFQRDLVRSWRREVRRDIKASSRQQVRGRSSLRRS